MSASRYRWDNLAELKHELHVAQSHILDLTAPEIREKCLSYHGCETWKDFFEWERRLIEFAIERTVPIPNASQFEERANCPLCGSGGNSRPEGYVFPGGLELHLAERNERPCPIMKAALHLAHHHLRPKLDEEELRATEALARRRQTETLYLVNPFDKPSLIEEGLPRYFFMGDSENILDSWDNGFEQRFAKRLQEALRRLKVRAGVVRQPEGE